MAVNHFKVYQLNESCLSCKHSVPLERQAVLEVKGPACALYGPPTSSPKMLATFSHFLTAMFCPVNPKDKGRVPPGSLLRP